MHVKTNRMSETQRSEQTRNRYNEYVGVVPEEINTRVVMAYGTVFRDNLDGEYWQRVWDMLKVTNPELFTRTDWKYPPSDSYEINVLGGMWAWQSDRIFGEGQDGTKD